jgi:hypothetical protein
MEMMIHFVFELIKISILATAYATILLLLFRWIARVLPDGWCDLVSRRKARFWFLSGFLISVGLFGFLFSYYGNHGLGDGPRIPIGSGLIVNNANWDEYGYVDEVITSDGVSLHMTRFRVVDDKLLGNLDSWFDTFSNAYFVYDMDSEELTEFASETEFNAYAKAHGLPEVTALRTFEENYYDRWGGWWFWLLP